MKKLISILISLVVVFTSVLLPVYAYAVTPLNLESLMLHYQKDGQTFAGLSVSIYRIAEAFSDGTFELVEPYNSFPIDIHGITTQEQWNGLCETLQSYIVAEQLAPYRQEKTNENSVATFTQLQTGIYFVSEVVAQKNGSSYVFNQFAVYLPTLNPDGSYNYDVEAKPKCLEYTAKTEYRVTKLWQDNGKQTDRPDEIEVDIYKDGKLTNTQILNAENNWSYVWYVSDENQSKWTVTERYVSENYNVTIQENNGYFSIINTHKFIQEDVDSPQTGDTVNITLYVLLMCISAIIMIVLGIYSWRRREK